MGRNKLINVHAVIPSSGVNGPGRRLVIFFQGCARNCAGCFNPETHSFKEVHLYTAEDIFGKFLRPGIDGITVSGGEPFNQRKGLFYLLKTAKERHGLSTVVYTGFNYEELLCNSPPLLTGGGQGEGEQRPIFDYIDVLIDGAFKHDMKEPTFLARGSANQRFLFISDRYRLKDFYMQARAEIIIGRDGVIKGTGFSKVNLTKVA